MNWMPPYWMMSLFSAHGEEIAAFSVLLIAGLLGYFGKAYLEKKFDFTPAVIVFVIASIVFPAAFVVWYGIAESRDAFNKEEELFKNYYYFGRVDGKSAIGRGLLYEKATLTPVYSGEFERNQRNGQGVQRYGNGDKYDGHWENNQRDGQGTYYYASGGRYEGMWKADKQTGTGAYYDADGNKRTYQNGIPIG